MLRTLAAVALATSVVAVAAPASAQDDSGRPMGLRFELGWNESLNLVGAAGAAGGGLVDPTGDIKIGYDFGQFTPLIGLSFVTSSRDTSIEPEARESFTTFIIDIEGRYYFKPHRKGLNPFVFGEFNTAFVSFGEDPEPDNTDELDEAASAADFTEINAGLGMEYKFDQSQFAIGGKWGLGFAFTPRDVGDDTFGQTTIGTVGAIYAAWRL